MHVRTFLAAAAAAVVAAGLSAPPAQAAAEPIVQGLAGPLSMSVDDGKVIVAQAFGGRLNRFDTDGHGGKALLKRRPDIEIAGVEAAGPGTLVTLTGKSRDGKKFAKLVHVAGDGDVRTLARMRGFEKRFNPDGFKTYGFRDVSDACLEKMPEEIGDPSYRGIKDSHPYATVRMPDGSVVVADAAGNDLIHVSPSGFRTQLAVLPGHGMRITAGLAEGMGLPKCAVGHKFWFEAVPTDVELHHGLLYVTTLPGGPEDPSLGARGRVYTVDPDTGEVTRIGRGFLGATGVAVSPGGDVYVAELFGGQISKLVDGKGEKVRAYPAPAALEWHNGRLFATVNVFENGSIVKFKP